MADLGYSPNAKAAGARTSTSKQWHVTNVSSPGAVVSFVNGSPAQGSGEVTVSNRSDGTVDVYYYM